MMKPKRVVVARPGRARLLATVAFAAAGLSAVAGARPALASVLIYRFSGVNTPAGPGQTSETFAGTFSLDTSTMLKALGGGGYVVNILASVVLDGVAQPVPGADYFVDPADRAATQVDIAFGPDLPDGQTSEITLFFPYPGETSYPPVLGPLQDVVLQNFPPDRTRTDMPEDVDVALVPEPMRTLATLSLAPPASSPRRAAAVAEGAWSCIRMARI